jgi:hypothetical protein
MPAMSAVMSHVNELPTSDVGLLEKKKGPQRDLALLSSMPSVCLIEHILRREQHSRNWIVTGIVSSDGRPHTCIENRTFLNSTETLNQTWLGLG